MSGNPFKLLAVAGATALAAGVLVISTTPLAASATSPVHQRQERPTPAATANSEYGLASAIAGNTLVVGARGADGGPGVALEGGGAVERMTQVVNHGAAIVDPLQ